MTFLDQMGRNVFLPSSPQRIISLVPSQTELLFDLGLDDRIVGVTKFCIHPENKVKAKAKVGGTKKFDFKVIASLKPDLIIGNKEENYKEGIETLALEYPVWMSDIFTLEDALVMMRLLGEITSKEDEVKQLIERIKKGFLKIQSQKKLRVAYLIWQSPLMVAAKNTFIEEMLQTAGFKNVFSHLERYPEVTEHQLQAVAPDLIFLSSEPYPFKEKHFNYFRKICPSSKILLVDGEVFSWYGSRLLHAPEYFNKLRTEMI